MKKLITILMCFQMIVAPVAMAEEKKSDTRASSQFEENPDSKGKNNYLQQIITIAQAAVGTSVIVSCRFAPLILSMKLYMAGSVVYIASEMMGAKDQKELLKRKTADIKLVEEKMKKSSGGGEVQKEALQQALKEQQDTLKFIKKRQMWINAVMAIYAAAMIAALLEVIKGKLPVSVPPGQIAGCVPASGAVKSTMTAKAVSAAYAYGMSSGSEGIGKYATMATAVLSVTPKMAATILSILNPPEARVAFFGIGGVLPMKMSGSALSSKADEIEKNIKKLEAAIKAFDQDSADTNSIATDTTAGSTDGTTSGSGDGTTSGANGSLTTSGSGSGSSAVNSLASGVGSTSSTPQQCWSQTTEGMTYSTAGCSSPLKIITGLPDNSMELPTLSSASASAERMANALAVENSAAAEVEAANLASMATRLNQAKDNLLKQANDKLKAEGHKPLDIEADAKTQIAAMNDVANSTLGTSGSTMLPPDLAKDSTIYVSPDDTNKSANGEINSIETASSNKVIDAKGANGNSGLGLSEGVDPSSLNGTKQATLSESLGNYEMNEGDISNGDNGVSLFKQLSNRYLLNYPKIFKKKEIAPSETPQKTPN